MEMLESQGGALSLRSLRQLGQARGVSEGTFVSVVRHSPVVSPLVTADGDQPFFTTVGGPAPRLLQSA